MSSHTLTRRRILEGLAGLGAASLLSGCDASFGNAPALSSAATTSQPTPAGALTTATATVAANSVGVIGPSFAGLSYEKTELIHSFFSVSNTNLLNLFKLIGPSLLRMGGDASDKFTWTPAGKGGIYGQISQADLKPFVAFLKASGWKCLYTVALGGQANGTTSAALAAAEVAYVSAQLGSSLYGIEIGNEPDAYGNAGSYYDGNWSLAQYEVLWNQYRTAILAQTPGVLITGPAGGHLATWTVPFSIDQTASKLSLLTDHYYRLPGSSNNATIAKLLAPDTTLVSNLQLMRNGFLSTGIPYRITETNSVSGGFPGVTDSFASALWAIDHLFISAIGGATGVNFHGGQGANYSPIGDDEVVVTGIAPEFYGILLFALAGQGTLYQTTLVAGSLNATAYAVKTTTGISIVLINKDATQNLNLTLQLPQPPAYANLFTLAQSTAAATTSNLAATSGVTIQGATVGIDGSFSPGLGYRLKPAGSTLTCYVPAASAVLIQAY